jgi:hypothetical protein
MRTVSLDYLEELVSDQALVRAAREWAADCEWLDKELLDQYDDLTILAGVDDHYDGGIRQFVRDM